MTDVYRMKNVVQTYSWGSRTAIPDLLGDPSPSQFPQAELWMGAHPKAPSEVHDRSGWIFLPDLIRQNPTKILGISVVKQFGAELPYLFKVLAAAKPLSIQAHPNRAQAQKGYMHEDRLGIPIDSDQRNYRDPNHKPELVCALSPFWALNGFRPPADVIDLLTAYFPGKFTPEKQILATGNGACVLDFFRHLMALRQGAKEAMIGHIIHDINKMNDLPTTLRWILRLHREYPGDIGILSPLFLNLIRLEPGQAMFLPAGSLHAYLEGTAIELMANSDNVLRAGLTGKHVDGKELLSVLNAHQRIPDILSPQSISPSEKVYAVTADEFRLSVIEVGHTVNHVNEAVKSVQILLCTRGRGVIRWKDNTHRLEVKRGESVLIPAAQKKYGIQGDAVFYKASVPDKSERP